MGPCMTRLVALLWNTMHAGAPAALVVCMTCLLAANTPLVMLCDTMPLGLTRPLALPHTQELWRLLSGALPAGGWGGTTDLHSHHPSAMLQSVFTGIRQAGAQLMSLDVLAPTDFSVTVLSDSIPYS
jgi:hypothetical protein